MSLEELDEFYRQQNRARLGTLAMTTSALALVAFGISLIPDGPPPAVTEVPITAVQPDVSRFGDAPRVGAAPPDAEDTGEPATAEEALGALLDAIDALRDAGAPCSSGGLGVLAESAPLTLAAQRQANYLDRSGVRAHDTPQSPHGRAPIDRAMAAGFTGSRVGEVLAWTESAEAAAAWWARSPEHCPILASPSARSIGVGVAGETWVALVGE